MGSSVLICNGKVCWCVGGGCLCAGVTRDDCALLALYSAAEYELQKLTSHSADCLEEKESEIGTLKAQVGELSTDANIFPRSAM